jgi:hypothetical protein
MDFYDSIKKFFSSEPPTPVFGLENKSPPHPKAQIYLSNHGYWDKRLPENYWQTLNHIRGQKVMPSGYTGLVASGPDAHLQGAGPIDSQYRTNRLIYPDQIPPTQGELGGMLRNDYVSTRFGGLPRELFVNGVQYPPRAPIEKSPRLTEKKRVIRMNTPAEKAAYLASQNERGFQLVGEPYNKYIESRTQLGSAIPYADGYRAGEGMRGTTYGYDYRQFAPEYINNPQFRASVNNYIGDGLGRAGKIAGGALLVGHALKEGPMDALVTATMGPIGRIDPMSEYGSQAYREMVASKKAEDDRRILETLAEQRYYEENADSINATRRMYLGR